MIKQRVGGQPYQGDPPQQTQQSSQDFSHHRASRGKYYDY